MKFNIRVGQMLVWLRTIFITNVLHFGSKEHRPPSAGNQTDHGHQSEQSVQPANDLLLHLVRFMASIDSRSSCGLEGPRIYGQSIQPEY